MRTIARALDYRKSLPQTARQPFRAFLSRLQCPMRILRFVEGSGAPAAIVYEARRQFIVCLCAAFELFWRTFYREAANSCPASRLNLKKLKNRSFCFEEVSTILCTKLTLGELLTFSFGFQGPEAVADFARDVLGVELITELGKAKWDTTIVSPARTGRPVVRRSVIATGAGILRERSLIEKCFEIRNEAAHASATRFRPSAARVKAYYGAICRFNLYASVVVENELSGDKLKAKEHRFFAGDLESLAKLLGPNPWPAGHNAQSRPDDSRKVAR